jgi:hypothetical protein
MVTGTGIIDSVGYDKAWTTLNHCIRNVRIATLHKVRMQMNGDQTALNTETRTTDDDNFGGTHKFYYDSTLIEEFDGLVTAEYNPDDRVTTITITGEVDSG